MSIKYPINFDNKISGRDDNGIRLTNIVGHNGDDFLKKCPDCEEVKPLLSGFGLRLTEGKDQSYCYNCRAKYSK